jgi:CDP-glucose 4,6-dehydratase
MSVIELTRLILDVMGRTDLEPIIQNIARAEIKDQYLDASKAKRILGWSTRITLREGMERTVAWYRDYLGASL